MFYIYLFNDRFVNLVAYLAPIEHKLGIFLFLKFGQAILVWVFMLYFEASCINRPLHNEHENVICAKKPFIEKDYKKKLVKNNIWVARIFFHVFFVKEINIILVSQNRNMHINYKKKFQS